MKLGVFSNNESYYKKETKKIIKILKNLGIKFEMCNKKANYNIIIVVGGDGTVFKVAKEYPTSALLSIKRLSCPVSSAFEKIKKGDYIIEKLTRIEVKYKNFKTWGINDISVLRDDEISNRFRVFINGKDIYKDIIIGDGIVIATPYGSTGYNWSAGGPVLNNKKIVITPICSSFFNKKFILNNRTLKKRVESKIISDNKKIVIRFFRVIRNKIVPDGRKEERIYFDAKPGDKILIMKSKEESKFVRIL